MAMTIHVDIVSAEQEIFSGPAEMVIAPGEYGDVGIAPRHAQMLTRLRPGEVRIKTGGNEEQFVYVSGGMLEVQPHVVTVLADTALRAKDIDEASAVAAKERAEKALSDQKADFDYAKAQVELAEAVAQLQTLRRLRERGRA
jgi:F-type H+-transporting ATPase subunit epsilon